MDVLYYEHQYPSFMGRASIFLAGPTLRSDQRTPWRLDALNILKNINYTGIVCIPEFSGGNFIREKAARNLTSKTILNWETFGLYNSSVILFWMPFCEDLPGLTTRAEFGYWMGKEPSKLAVGMPGLLLGPPARGTGFIRYHCISQCVPLWSTLEETVAYAIGKASRDAPCVTSET